MKHTFLRFILCNGLKFIVLICFLSVNIQLFLAQPAAQKRKKKPYSWILASGYAVVNDNEEKLPNLFDVQGSWNCAVYPSYFSINKYARKGFSHEGLFSYTPYRTEAIVNDNLGIKGFLASANYAYKLNFNQFIRTIPEDIDPFIAIGGGLTYRSFDLGGLCATTNLHVGLNLWFSKHWGVQIQGIGKLALVSDVYRTRQDYIQFTGSVTYRILPSKRYKRDKRRYKWIHERQRYRKGDTR